MKNTFFAFLTVVFAVGAIAQTVFVQDREVVVVPANYDVSKIPDYELEDPLTFVDGRKVKTPADWA
jgi:hypothetical protein